MSLTEDELATLDAIREAYSRFCDLPRAHPHELEEAVVFIHGLQRLVMARSAIRAHPERFTGGGQI